MNILVHIPDIAQDWGGVRQYSVAMLRILAADKLNKYFLYHNVDDPEILSLISENKHFNIVNDADVSECRLKKKVDRFRYIITRIQKKIGFDVSFAPASIVDRLCDAFKIDIIHCPYQFLPLTNRAKLIFTLHDVQELHFPQFFSAEARARRAVTYLDYTRRADKIIVSYTHVKNDIVKYFSVKEDEVHVILLNMSKLWFEQFNEVQATALPNIPVSSPFILYPANTWEHKNHIKLIECIALLRDRDKIQVNLICSGDKTTYFEEIISKRIEQLSLQDQISFVGVLDELTLYTFYKRALGVVVPTLYEAGSFPLMESILLGIPVICSDVTSLPETIGDSEFIFNPHSVSDIAEKVKLLWESNDYRQRSIDNSRIASQRIKDTHALEKFVQLYESLRLVHPSVESK